MENIDEDLDFIPWTVENPHFDPRDLIDEAILIMEDCFSFDYLELPF